MAMGGKAGEVFTEINVTPLTDVFLVLLVIMILIAPLVNQAVLKMNPPGNGPGTLTKEATIEAIVSADGQISINKKPVNADTLSVMTAIRSELAQAGKRNMPLVLKADKEAKQRYVVAVMDAAAGCNLQNASILVLDSACEGKRR